MKASAVLLAGGRSRRMGEDKAALPWHGVPLWRVQLEKLAALGLDPIAVSCRAEQASQFADIGRTAARAQLVFDPPGQDSGPLGAITRALAAASGPMLVLAVDLPFMTVEFLRDRLLAIATQERGMVFHSAHGYETLAALYVPAMLPLLEHALRDRNLALQPVIQACMDHGFCIAQELLPVEEHLFANANTPQDWAGMTAGQ